MPRPEGTPPEDYPDHLAEREWVDRPICPYCGEQDLDEIDGGRVYLIRQTRVLPVGKTEKISSDFWCRSCGRIWTQDRTIGHVDHY